jgi:dipeptidyl aminopeptidase/acylaminoacyl peptidase
MRTTLTVLLSLAITITRSVFAAEEPQPTKLTGLEIKIGRVLEGAAPASMSVSPDRKRIAFFRKSTESDKWWLVVDDIEGEKYDAVGNMDPLFSPNSHRVAFVAGRKGRKLIVVDAVEGKEYEAVSRVTFSPDSKHFAYLAERGDERFAVVDGVEQPAFDGLHASGPVFSPDSLRLGYVVKRGVKWLAIVDGNEGKEYDGAGEFVFSPDSKHWAHMATQDGRSFVVLDGVESEPYDGFLRETALIFTSPYTVEAIVHRNRQILRVALTNLESPPTTPARLR